jgi:hypothetical protein
LFAGLFARPVTTGYVCFVALLLDGRSRSNLVIIGRVSSRLIYVQRRASSYGLGPLGQQIPILLSMTPTMLALCTARNVTLHR